MAQKLLAEWFWTDRWMGSSAFLLPMEARGIYREMLTQAWRRGARLPNDHVQIQRAIGATSREWTRSWPKVERFWRIDGDGLVNDTQVQVYAEARDGATRATDRARRAAQARHKQNISTTQVELGHSSGLALLSPSLRTTYRSTGADAPAYTHSVEKEKTAHEGLASSRISDPLRDCDGGATGGTVDDGRGMESARQGSPGGAGVRVSEGSGNAHASDECGESRVRETPRTATHPGTAATVETETDGTSTDRPSVARPRTGRRGAVTPRTDGEVAALTNLKGAIMKAWSAR